MTDIGAYSEVGDYQTYQADLVSYAAPNVVFNSLDLEPAEGTGYYAMLWAQTTQTGGFDYQADPLIPAGANQAAQIQAQAALDGTQSRIVTAVSFDASGNAVLISYGWTGDTATVYEAQTTVVPASGVVAAATDLAGQGYFISAFGGNDADGFVLVGMRVEGDSLPRPVSAWPDDAIATAMPYYTPVLYLDEVGTGMAIVYEQ